ncbi:phage tail tape measure C-terminal domain-containing protein [Sphingomonas faeni]|uniref:phage tail tape measure C-terminal domain-containing protein n=1 Tax=Sphingomonas faeni TaxID=185950 RepID=UPI00335BDA29
MAGAIIGALRVVLGIDTAQFEAGSKRAETRAYALGERIGKSMRGAVLSTTSLKSALVGLGGALALKELAGATQRAFDYADAIQDLADRTGASTKTIQEFRFAAQLSGSSVEVADAAMEKFARTLGQAQAGGDAQVKLFRQLGVTSGNFDEALRQTMDGLAKLPSTQQRAALGFQAFGKSSATLTGLMGQGSRGFDELAAKAQELGIVLKDDVIRNAGGANDKLDALKMILNAQFANAVVQNANSLVAMADGLTTLTSAVIKFLSSNPAQALAIIGALAGSRAGPIGAAIGGIAGYATGTALKRNADDANGDLDFRRKAYYAARRDQRARERSQQSGGLITVRRANGSGDGSAAETERQRTLYQNARAARKAGLGAPKSVALPKVGTGEAGSAASKAKSDAAREAREREHAAKEAKRNEEAYNSDLSRLNVEQLGLKQQIATDLRTSAMYEHERVTAEGDAAQYEITSKQQDGKLTAAQAERLRLVEARNIELQHTAINWKLDDDLVREQVQISDETLSLQGDLLRGQQDGARTQAERRRIELSLLDIEYDRQKAALESVLALHSSTDAEKAIAQARLDQLGTLKGIDQANVRRGTMGPLEQYLDTMPKNAAEANEAFQQVASDGLKSLNDGLADAITGSKSLADVFKNVSKQIISDLVRIAIQQAIIKPLSQSLFGASSASGSGGSGGLFGKLFKAASTALGSKTPVQTPSTGVGLPRLAKGGSFRVAGNTGLDRNVLALNGVPTAMVNYGERVHVTPANDVGRQTPSVVQLVLGEGQLFEPRVTGIAGNVSVETVDRVSAAQNRLRRRTLVK